MMEGDDEFVECAACGSLPGQPPLCGPCLHNRNAIELLQRQVRRLRTVQDIIHGVTKWESLR